MSTVSVRRSGTAGVTSYTAGDNISYRHECSGDLSATPDSTWAELLTVADKPLEDNEQLRAAVNKDLKSKGITPPPSKPRKKNNTTTTDS